MKIMVTGANGFLGQHLCLFLSGKGFEVHAVSRGGRRIPAGINILYHDVELTDVRKIHVLIRSVQPDVIIHTAAMSKPDECHDNKAACLLNNVEITRQLVTTAKEHSIYFIYISTDFIFGEHGPHAEDGIPDPLNFYGESKLMAEAIVTASGLAHAIVRPVFIYGKCWDGLRPSFLHWVKNNLEQGRRIKVVTDQWRTPTYVGDLCAGLEQLILRRVTGIYHLAGKDIVSPCDMALTVAKILVLDTSLIEPVTADTFPEPVQRAKRSGLTIEKAVRDLAYAPVGFEEGVRLTFIW